MAEVLTAAKSRRTWPQRLLLSFNVFVVIAALASAGVLGYSNKELSSVTRVGGIRGLLTPEGERAVGEPANYLIVGADDGTGLPEGDPVNKGRGNLTGSFRTDTIMILRIDPSDATARVLSIPRDLWVKIPGLKSANRINAAVEVGGAPRLIQTITSVFDIPIDHYIQVNFAGFKKLVDDIEGVPIYFNEPVRSRKSTPFLIPDAGCKTLDGNQALDFVRIRKDYQYQTESGKWLYAGGNDYQRIERQQFFIQAVISRAFDRGIRNPNTLRKLIDTGIGSIKIDDRLRTEDLLTLGNRFRNFDPADLIKYSVPAVQAFHGAADVLDINKSEAEPILDIFRGKATDPAQGDQPILGGSLSASDVRVQTQNGGGVKGQARLVTRDLAALGFDTLIPTDAPSTFANTTIQYAPGKAEMARYVARFVGGEVTLGELDPAESSSDADVVVVIGDDWEGTETSPKPESEVPAPSTTTTMPPSTTTTSTTVPQTTTTEVNHNVPEPAPPGVSCG